jgi:hypothetical protein
MLRCTTCINFEAKAQNKLWSRRTIVFTFTSIKFYSSNLGIAKKLRHAHVFVYVKNFTACKIVT